MVSHLKDTEASYRSHNLSRPSWFWTFQRDARKVPVMFVILLITRASYIIDIQLKKAMVIKSCIRGEIKKFL